MILNKKEKILRKGWLKYNENNLEKSWKILDTILFGIFGITEISEAAEPPFNYKVHEKNWINKVACRIDSSLINEVFAMLLICQSWSKK